ncbi:MAG: MFS transporter [Haloquadratum sp.]|nr:MFS transporter [Haloquadratum sp.]
MPTRLFSSLLVMVFMMNFGRTIFAPFVEEFQVVFGVGPAALGVVTSLVWFGAAAGRIPVAYGLTRISRHRMLGVMGGVGVGGAMLTAMATTVGQLQLGALALGLGAGGYFVIAVPLLGAIFPDAVGRSIGVHGMAAQVAAVVVGPVAIVAIATDGWRVVFWAIAVTLALVTVVSVSLLRARADTGASTTHREFTAVIAHWRPVAVALVITATAGFLWIGYFNFFVSYLLTAKGVGITQGGWLLTVMFAAGVPAFYIAGRVVDRLPPLPFIYLMLSCFAVGIIALTAVQRLWAVVAVTILIGFSIHTLFPSIDTWLIRQLDPAVRESAYASFTGLSLLIESAGPGTVGWLVAQGVGYDVVFRTFAVIVLVMVAVMTILTRSAGRAQSRWNRA